MHGKDIFEISNSAQITFRSAGVAKSSDHVILFNDENSILMARNAGYENINSLR